MKLNNRGFTLVEMIVVTAIFVVIIMITGDAFKTILNQTMKLYKSEESNIEGVIGLEMFRHDLEQAGFGLPDSFQSAITYLEAGNEPASLLNDAGTTPQNISTQIPRPFVTLDSASGLSDSTSESGTTYNVIAGTDYLSIKATSVGLTPAAQKWTYMSYTSAGNAKPPQAWSGANLNNGDQVIVLRRTFQTGGGVSNQLVSSSSYYTTYHPAGLDAAFTPAVPGDTYYAYGVLDNPSTALRMPFNRVDYLVAKPSDGTKFPKTCAPNTGILYKAVVDHGSNSGTLIYTPILDCVADMQVVLGWDLADASGNVVTDATITGDGLIDTWTNADGNNYIGSVDLAAKTGSATYVHDTILTDPGHIKTKLKIIKIYILAQNGRLDPAYTSPSSILIGDPGEKTITKPTTNGNYNLTANMLNYRWKLYRLVIKPKNLISNQQ